MPCMSSMNLPPVRGVWSGADEAGMTRESVELYVARLADAGVNAIFMNVKQGDGSLCWPSKLRPEAVKPGYDTFDFPAELIEAGMRHGVAIHAWMIDYMEGENGPAFRQHPEWAVRNAQGQLTNEETLRGRRFTAVWMCPAQRPGYTDQWLVPLYGELAERYEFASLHHDYIRYPGDLAPDQYCFCDYCMEHLPTWAGLLNRSFRDEPFLHPLYDRPYLEAHWEPSPRMLPAAWDKFERSMKAKILLEGSSFAGGRADLDYFFYTYRTHQINEFARLSAEAVREANPNTKLSGAYFKHPVLSGRFIGQDWRNFRPWSDIFVPMDYRDHYPGTVAHYHTLLADTIEDQKQWVGEGELYVGFALWPLFVERPEGPYPQEYIAGTFETIARAAPDGVVVFCSGDLDRYGAWDTLREWYCG